MLITLSEFDLGQRRAKCFVGSDFTSFDLGGLSTSRLSSTGGSFDPSHLEQAWQRDKTSCEEFAVLAAENAAELVSDHSRLELWGGSFGFDETEGLESQIVVRFIPSIESIALLPTYQRNLRLLGTSLNRDELRAIERHANSRRLLPDMCLPVKMKTDRGGIDALMRLKMRAGVASICSMQLFGAPDAVSRTATVFQPGLADGEDVELGSIENLTVYCGLPVRHREGAGSDKRRGQQSE